MSHGDRPIYVLHPGVIVSASDQQVHHIGAVQLMRLYGLRRSDRIRIADDRVPDGGWDVRGLPSEGIVHLYPQYWSEDYRLP